MRILLNNPDGDLVTTTLEREPDEDLLGYRTGSFYRINGQVFSGHDIGVMEEVTWNSQAQEWKVIR